MPHANTDFTKPCAKDHTPNEVTKQAIESFKTKRGAQRADTVTELFEKLRK